MRRGYIPLTEKLAALLAPSVMRYEQQKLMSAEQIISLFEWDHYPIPKAHGGPDVHWNLVPRRKADHHEKTAKIDIPQIAKSKRLRKKWKAHAAAIAAGIKPPKGKSKWPRRGFRSRRRKWLGLGT